MTIYAIVDIDGTICDRSTHEAWKRHNGNWDALRQHCETVKPIPQVLDLVRELCWHYKVEIMTSRSEQLREVTTRWLAAHQINFTRLTMRSPTDVAPDYVAKIAWAQALGMTPDVTAFVLEDKPKVVAAFRAAGYVVLQPCADVHEDDSPQDVVRRRFSWSSWLRGRYECK